MWDWTGHMDGWWWLAVPLMIAFWSLVVWGVVTLVRGRDRGAADRAEDILAERFARGELDETEYRRRRDLVRTR
ncbi:MAG: SHOCT domain-containing protein [Chloroflexota bacterium]